MTRTRQGLLATLAASALVLAAGGVPSASAAPAGDGPRSTYVVVLHDGVDPRSAGRGLADRYGGELGHVYEHALRGFSVTVPEKALQGISRDPRVRYVERDQVFRTTEVSPEVPTGVQRAYADDNTNLAIDDSANERVDVDIAIIDTGLDSDHPDLNIAGGTNCSGGGPFRSKCTDGTYEDGNGHGTHVGGSAAAKDDGAGVVGMAPGARLWGVKVLGDNGSGYTSWIIAGIDWVTGKAGTIEVANMSLGCECFSQAQDDAITRSVAAGVTYAVAAGNSDKDASTFSPANHPDVITVSALADFDGLARAAGSPTCREDEDDTLANFSNFGAGVEIAAPGVCILSTWPGGGYNTISGTSMASPHVAGAAALLASTRSTGSKADTAAIQKSLVDAGNLDWTDDSGDRVKERLLDVHDTTVFAPAMLTDDGGTGNNAAPTASFSYSCSSLTCAFDAGGSTDDVGISSYAWEFGDNATGDGVTVEHTYGSASSYTVTLTVSDGSLNDSEVKTVTVSSSSITLSATAYKVKGTKNVDLVWSGMASTVKQVDVYRNGTRLEPPTPNDGSETDTISTKGGGSYTYKVCEYNTTTCSPDVTVTF